MDIKRNLIAGFEKQIQKSREDDLVEELKIRTEEVATQREKVSLVVLPSFRFHLRPAADRIAWLVIPTVQLSDIKAGAVPLTLKSDALLLQGARDYFAQLQHKFNGLPSNADKKVSIAGHTWRKSVELIRKLYRSSTNPTAEASRRSR
jgi:hypothetical protein